MKKLPTILSILIGIIFLVSGYAKAVDSAYFSNILNNYGTFKIGLLAPLVIVSEILLGLLLLLGIYRRISAWVSIAFICVITIGFSYGLIFHGIHNCGCFGHLDFLNLSPIFTYIRNVVLISILAFIAFRSQNESGWKTWKIIVFCTGITIGGFIAGYTFPNAAVLQNPFIGLRHKPIQETELGKYIQTSNDSTYLVYAFSFSCPHCMQNLGNVCLYEPTGVVDKVYGLAFEDSLEEAHFKAFFKDLPMEIKVIPQDSMVNITDELPMMYFIRHDTLIAAFDGTVPSPRFLRGFNSK